MGSESGMNRRLSRGGQLSGVLVGAMGLLRKLVLQCCHLHLHERVLLDMRWLWQDCSL
jgi:hypothetical protein